MKSTYVNVDYKSHIPLYHFTVLYTSNRCLFSYVISLVVVTSNYDSVDLYPVYLQDKCFLLLISRCAPVMYVSYCDHGYS